MWKVSFKLKTERWIKVDKQKLERDQNIVLQKKIWAKKVVQVEDTASLDI